MIQTFTCNSCEKPFSRIAVRGQRPRFCPACRTSRRLANRTCKRCGAAGVRADQDYCSRGCTPQKQPKPKQLSMKMPIDQRSPIRRAVEDGELSNVIAAVRQSVTIDPSTDCWNWERRLRDGYAVARVGKREVSVHRLVMGEPAGPVVHHVCANRRCVNPEHLQLVTQRENIAEMLERNYYLARIAELEAALSSVAPSHPALLATRPAVAS